MTELIDEGWMCDLCSLNFEHNQLKKMWNGLMACKDCFEERHPCDFPPKQSPKRKVKPPLKTREEVVFMTIAERNPDLL